MFAAQVLERVRLCGTSPAFLAAVRHLADIAGSPAPVMVLGETGTGKELVGRGLHLLGPRAAGPFVAVNCGSLPDSLVEGELFGHDRGAFTDAHRDRPGLIAQADRGTLFLDEIDALSPKAQVVLLRFLQEQRYRPIGGTAERTADVRIVAASNADLGGLVRTGGFRADLFYRLCVLDVRLPPLRDRREDVALLARHFLAKHAAGGPPLTLSADAVRALAAHDWPGNVRELENVLLRACVLVRDRPVTAADLGLTTFADGPADVLEFPRPFRALKREAIEQFERAYLTRLIRDHGGNVSSAARSAGKDRRELGKLLKKYRIAARPEVLRIG